MLMDQRVISTSAVRCVGNTLILQGRVYSPPYVITAIGDTDAMRGRARRRPEVENLRQWSVAVGLGYDVAAGGEQTFPAYSRVDRPGARRGRPSREWPAGSSGGPASCWSRWVCCCSSSSAGSCGGPTSRPTATQGRTVSSPRAREFARGSRAAACGRTASRTAVGADGAFAIVRIPRFGADYARPVIEGTGRDVLALGVGHYVGTAGPGEVGNFALAGHRTTYGRPFHDIDRLRRR